MSDAKERVYSATYARVARVGLDKTTLDDVAKEAEISRATLYRMFPGGREQILRETIGAEMDRFFISLANAIADASDIETCLERGLVFARKSLLEHAVLQKILTTEPEALLPIITIEQHRIVGEIAQYLVPLISAEKDRLRSDLDPARAAEFLARMVLSIIASPGRWDLSDPQVVHALVGEELLAGILQPRS
jgi:AcrR family transcriptional regulator